MMIQPLSRCLLIVLLLVSVQIRLSAQRGDMRLMFYNLENLFDTIDNPDTRDDEFSVNGEKHWDNYRYWRKIKQTYQVIAAAGEQKPPEILGVCEVESFLPLHNLIYNTPLSKYPYSIVHQDSPDKRGIDVALLYQSENLRLIHKEFITVKFPSEPDKTTRDVLLTSFLAQNDTLHVFVNHWPSRLGGQAYSEPFRVHVAGIIRKKVDSIQQKNPQARIIIMGDFNDEPNNKSLMVLKSSNLVNLSEELLNTCNCGTYKYKSYWNMLDQILVSASLKEKDSWHIIPGSLKIYRQDFLLENDETNGGKKPYRTYLGPRYLGGYSDHLPILLDVYFSDNK